MGGSLTLNLYIPSSLTQEQLQAIISVLPSSRNEDFMLAADEMVYQNAYTIPPFGTKKYENTQSIPWDLEVDQSRSFLRLIHGHSFLGCLMEAYRETNELTYVYKGMHIIRDWIAQHPIAETRNTMAYHDETTALRLQYWLRFYMYARDKMAEKDRLLLEEKMRETAALLAQPDFHSTNTNHGMFQDMALLLYALYFDKQREENQSYKDLAITRLKAYFMHIFTLEGVHKEHAPAYHLTVAMMVKDLASLLAAVDAKVSQRFIEIYQRAEEYATYIIRPDGCLPPISDTEMTQVESSEFKDLYDSPHYLYAMTRGEQGEPPKDHDRVFQESGYAIFRDDWSKKEKATYVLFSAAYHTEYHKHSDDLNLYIYSDGEMITEAGPNGYNYKDPYTQYAYSSYAHNTLIVDGQGLPRVDQQYDKVYLQDYHLSLEESEATGVNERFEGVKHIRNVQYKKKENYIIVKDYMQSDQKHAYKILWHIASDIHVYVRDSMVELFRNERKVRN